MRFRNHSASFQDDETTVPQETPWSIWISLAINRGWLGFSERRKWRFIAGKTKMQMVDLCHCHVCLPQGTGKADITSAAESLKSRITALGTVMWPWGPRPENVTFFLTFTGSPWQDGMVYENLMNSGEITMGKTHPLPSKLRQAAIDDLHRICT